MANKTAELPPVLGYFSFLLNCFSGVRRQFLLYPFSKRDAEPAKGKEESQKTPYCKIWMMKKEQGEMI